MTRSKKDDYTARVMEESQNQSQNYSQDQHFVSSGFSNDKTPVSFPEPKKKDSNSPIGLIVIIVVLSLILGGGGFLIYANKDALPFIGAKQTPTPTPVSIRVSPMPTELTPTPTPESVKADMIDKDSISINVLNGTGVPGEAKSVQDALLALGYSEVTIGNASKQDYVITEVLYSTSVPEAVVSEIVTELQKKYKEVKSKKGIPSKGDVEIIVGQRKGYSASPTPKKQSTSVLTPTPTLTKTITATATPSLTKTPTKTPSPTPTQSPN
ncbi:MAG: LytR C-terminal domain-containing protein [Patescibacteria group bacterium]|nr:LytR C-terminal domain-containing protein [Patescibacteria group bacterium]